MRGRRNLTMEGKTVSLLDEITKEARHGGSKCSVGSFLRSLDDKDRSEWVEAFAGDHPHSVLGRIARRRGFPLGDGSIGYHRNKHCRCEQVGAS